MSLETVHLDGFRARSYESETELRVDLIYVRDGVEADRREFARWQGASPDELVAHYATMRRVELLAAAVCRYLTAGGTTLEIGVLHAVFDGWHTHGGVQIELPGELSAVESQEAHVTLFRVPSGNYVRIIEDEVAEELTPEELLADSDEPPPGRSYLDLLD